MWLLAHKKGRADAMLHMQTPLYMQNGAVLQQVFDLSHNRFSGSLPSFLAQQAVPSWTQGGIYLEVTHSAGIYCPAMSFKVQAFSWGEKVEALRRIRLACILM